ncbi:O-antigen/teichoic acid export membrane protein [Glaciihabitans tibetensis]|uniref:O-antigen/teichoic acid export membrane protein n=1 Tax=Glaciihabitans tibetensis TaxID=1266600 RepID=A0A2T0VA54_9MICO|nr:oligosaccharide flippase family protein [Glaciihabitans tibetensis]PRY67031.1 O-antigen/teichoic acid export membrane protein [Glaciihabitans tibetensis]
MHSGADSNTLTTAIRRAAASPGPPATVACVILAHTDPAQLRRLIEAVDPFPVFLHCDPKTPPETFARMVEGLPERCRLLDRYPTGWARWGNVEAELAGYRAALAETDASHIAVLTGTDYPLASSAEITSILGGYHDKSIANLHLLPFEDWGMGGGIGRLRYRHWAYRKHTIRLPIPRRIPRDIVLAGGSQLKILSRRHAAAVVAAAEARPDLVAFWRRSWIPDETFVPSILSTPQFVPGWQEEHENASAWWIGWTNPPTKSPPWLGSEMRDELLEGRQYGEQTFPRLFARKFSSERSSELLDAIDTRRRSSVHAASRESADSPQEPARARTMLLTGPTSIVSASESAATGTSVSASASASVSATASATSSPPLPAQPAPPQLPPPPAHAGPAAIEVIEKPESNHLFGRGLLYVVVWALQLIAGTVVSPILAYALGPAEFGALASAIALHQVLSVLALLGLDQAIVLQRAEDPSGRTARGLLSVGIALSFAVTLVLAATGGLWATALGFEGFTPLVLAVILWTAPGAVVQAILALLVAEDRLRAFTFVSALSAVGGQLVGLFLLFFVHGDATTYAWGGVVSQFLAMFIGIAICRPLLRGLFDWKVASRAIKLGAPLAIGGLGYFVLNAGDRIVIQSLLGPAEVGRYQVAYVVGYTVVLLLSFTSSAWLPRFAAVRDEAERWLLSAQSRDELYRLLIPVVFAVTLAAPVALRLVAPPSFDQETLLPVVFLVALSAYPVAASGATARLLITLRRGKPVAAITLTAAVVNIGLNIVLVPVMGIAGAAAATVLSFLLVALLQRFALPRTPAWVGTPTPLLASIGASILLAAASLLLPQTDAWNISKFVIAAACLPWFFVVLRRARRGPTPSRSQS